MSDGTSFLFLTGTVMNMDTVGRAAGAKYECLLFDMDDTLYPLSTGFNLACRKNIEEFMLKYLNIEESEVPRMCLELYREYGTTMAGLKVLGYEFDNDEFHAYAHGRLPYETLRPDPVLRNLLLAMPQRKIVSESIICFETLNHPPLQPPALKSPILCKPSLEAFEAAIRVANLDPKKTIFFDDSARNIASGKAAGLHTVIVGNSALVPGADHALRSIHNIKEAIPEIWDGDEEQMEQVIQAAAVETVVLA
ncbi:hypothetical protein Golax_016587 [Gossypium laxum]|uniref:Uncharacterized protein n=1 Tax=Gossypium laxum TaxID=34288 RepID=A0A7J8YXL3_9ROSI|nr:hypothetical protein [Gossypium laxum]